MLLASALALLKAPAPLLLAGAVGIVLVVVGLGRRVRTVQPQVAAR